MKSVYLLFLSFLITTKCLHAQAFKEKELKTTIRDVTVFLKGAHIHETGSVLIPAGNTILKVKGLSAFLDERSIQVRASEADFTILSVNHRLNYLEEGKSDREADSLRERLKILDTKTAQANARLEVLQEKQSLLNENKNLSNNKGISIDELRLALAFYDKEITAIKEEEIRINKNKSALDDERNAIDRQLRERHEIKTQPTSEVEIRVNSKAQMEAVFDLTYMVSNAGWFPKYDARVHSISKPLELVYKAEVFQNTGVDWKNVKLKFSNGNPDQSGQVPDVNVWLLGYSGYNNTYDQGLSPAVRTVSGIVVDDAGNPLPGVSVVVKGSTIGTITDSNGRYLITLPNNASSLQFSFIGYAALEMPILQQELNVALKSDSDTLSERVDINNALQGRMAGVIRVRGLSSIRRNYKEDKFKTPPTSVLENQTTVEMVIDIPYTIESNGEKLLIDLKEFNIDADYQYYAVPKRDKDAFLVASIVNWEQYNLLEGEVNLYFEEAYVGRSVLDTKNMSDTLSISLGRDKNVSISRTKVNQLSRRQFIGANKVEDREFKFQIRNKKSESVKISITDQLPVSIVNDIVVTPVELNGGTLDDKTGKVVWQVDISSKEQKEWVFHYEVKYPKRERVFLE